MDDQDKAGAYQRGYTAGYQARIKEEVATYFQAITAGHQVYDRVIRGLVNVPSHSERELRRTWVVWQGHVAGLHNGYQTGRGCPFCDGTLKEHPWARAETCPDCAHGAYVHTASGCQAVDTVDTKGLDPQWAARGSMEAECSCQIRDDMFLLPARCPDCGHVETEHGPAGCNLIVTASGSLQYVCPCEVGPPMFPYPGWIAGEPRPGAVNEDWAAWRRGGATIKRSDSPLYGDLGEVPGTAAYEERHGNRGPVPAHNGHYGAPCSWHPDGEFHGACDGCGEARDAQRNHGAEVDHGQHADIEGMPGLCICGVPGCVKAPAPARPSDYDGPVACSFHGDGAEGYRADCGACVLATQRAARR